MIASRIALTARALAPAVLLCCGSTHLGVDITNADPLTDGRLTIEVVTVCSYEWCRGFEIYDAWICTADNDKYGCLGDPNMIEVVYSPTPSATAPNPVGDAQQLGSPLTHSLASLAPVPMEGELKLELEIFWPHRNPRNGTIVLAVP